MLIKQPKEVSNGDVGRGWLRAESRLWIAWLNPGIETNRVLGKSMRRGDCFDRPGASRGWRTSFCWRARNKHFEATGRPDQAATWKQKLADFEKAESGEPGS